MKRSTEETTTLIEQAELTSLVPEGLDTDAVNRYAEDGGKMPDNWSDLGPKYNQ